MSRDEQLRALEHECRVMAEWSDEAENADQWRAHAGLCADLLADPAPTPAEGSAEDLTFTAFSAVNRERCESQTGFNHALASWDTSDWFLALFGELGEAANIAKKLNRVRDGIAGNKETEAELRDKLRRELGDGFVYLDLLAQSLGVNIGAAAVEVFNAKSDEIGCPIKMPPAGMPSGAPGEEPRP